MTSTQTEILGGAILGAQSKAGWCDYESLVDAVLELRAETEFEGMGIVELGAWISACRLLVGSDVEAVNLFERMAWLARSLGRPLDPQNLQPRAREAFHEMVAVGGDAAARAMTELEPA